MRSLRLLVRPGRPDNILAATLLSLSSLLGLLGLLILLGQESAEVVEEEAAQAMGNVIGRRQRGICLTQSTQ
jgi:hypothetical protein